MQYYFTWNSFYLIEEKVKAWETKFIWKFGEFNYTQIKDLEEFDNNFLSEILTWNSFLSQKKLITIKLNWNKSEINKINFILWLLNNIPEDNIVLFYETKPDKRSKHYKTLKSNSTHSEFNIKDTNQIIQEINKKYQNKISPWAISKIIDYKSQNLSKIFLELNKLFICKDFIDVKDIEENIFPELEESIFQIIDCLLNLDKELLINKIDILLNQTNIYAFYNNFLANIRTNLYILKYKSLKINNNLIIENLKLWNRGFLVNKNQKISFDKLKFFYVELINLDKKMKTWNLFENNDKALKFEINKLILSL